MNLTSNARRFYVDVYSGQSVVSFEFSSLDSALTVIEHFVVKAQTISVYSYEQNPFNHGSENIFQATSQTSFAGLIFRRSRRRSFPRCSQAQQSHFSSRSSRQYSRYQSQRISGRYRDWRPSTGQD